MNEIEIRKQIYDDHGHIIDELGISVEVVKVKDKYLCNVYYKNNMIMMNTSQEGTNSWLEGLEVGYNWSLENA